MEIEENKFFFAYMSMSSSGCRDIRAIVNQIPRKKKHLKTFNSKSIECDQISLV